MTDTTLHKAVADGNTAAVSTLLSQGADVDATEGNRGATPLHVACKYGRKEIVELLIRSKADLNIRDSEGKTPLLWALNAILSREHNKKIIDERGKSGLLAMERDEIDILKLLFEAKADINVRRSDGKTPLHWSGVLPSKEIYSMLVNSHGVVLLNKQDVLGNTPLHIAVTYENIKIIELLIDLGADLNLKNCNGHTPLHLAVVYDNDRVIKTLLDAGADVNEKTAKGGTPLHGAVAVGNERTVELLIAAGADVNAKRNDGLTALQWAVMCNQNGSHSGVIEILLASNELDRTNSNAEGCLEMNGKNNGDAGDVVEFTSNQFTSVDVGLYDYTSWNDDRISVDKRLSKLELIVDELVEKLSLVEQNLNKLL